MKSLEQLKIEKEKFETEIEDLGNSYSKLYQEFQSLFKIDNFVIKEIHHSTYNGWSFSFYSTSKIDTFSQINFDYYIGDKNRTGRVSISGLSLDFREDTSYKEVNNTITYYSEYLKVLSFFKNPELLKEVCYKAMEHYNKILKPYLNAKLIISRNLDTTQKQITKILDDSKNNEIMKFFSEPKTFYFYKSLLFSTRRSSAIYSIRIEKNNKGNFVGITPTYTYKIPLNIAMLHTLYNHIHREELGRNNWKDDGLYKLSNSLTKEEFENHELIKKIPITSEEYKIIRKKNRGY